MSKLAIIVNKTCNICKFCDVDENFISLICSKNGNSVEDNSQCGEFEVSEKTCEDCLQIEDILEYKEIEQ